MAAVLFSGVQAAETAVVDGDPVDNEEVVGDEVGEGVMLDVGVVESVFAMADRAPRPATGLPSGRANGEPTSQTGWSWTVRYDQGVATVGVDTGCAVEEDDGASACRLSCVVCSSMHLVIYEMYALGDL